MPDVNEEHDSETPSDAGATGRGQDSGPRDGSAPGLGTLIGGLSILAVCVAGALWFYSYTQRSNNADKKPADSAAAQPATEGAGQADGRAQPADPETKPPDPATTTEKPPETTPAVPAGQQGEPPSRRIERWVELLKSPNLRANMQAVFQLEKRIRSGGEESVALLMELVKTETDQTVRSWAVRLLGDFRSKTPMVFLTELLRRDANEGVRMSAANALGNIGDKTVLNVLTAASLEDSSKGVTDAARKAIERIEARKAGKE
ncbi:MAG: HEAT repeat domain-containing protein [Planctomycetota bacterium]|nr:HEAT repeat domain-containing protein [Planctomycetota bacterium]